MIYSNLLSNILDIIDDSMLKKEIEGRFIPLYNNTGLITAINNISDNSPIFQKAISNLREGTAEVSVNDFIKEYEKFHNEVMITCDEVALTIKKEADLIKELNIPVTIKDESAFISSRVFVGNSILLMLTSNDELLCKTLEHFRMPNLKTKIMSEASSA